MVLVFAVKDGHRLFALSPKTDLHRTISTDCSSMGKVHFNPLLSGSVIAFGPTPIASRALKKRPFPFSANSRQFPATNADICVGPTRDCPKKDAPSSRTSRLAFKSPINTALEKSLQVSPMKTFPRTLPESFRDRALTSP